MAKDNGPSTEVALTAGAKLPANFEKVIGFEAWARAIVFKETYAEPNPDFISTMLAMQAITAATIEEVFQASGILKLQEMLEDRPRETTGPLEITDLYVAASDFETGNPTFVIITAVKMEDGEEIKFSTGATNVQATLIGLLRHGVWPMRVQIKRGESKDKGGRYLLHVLPPD
jgi:hypothetical protein